MAVEPELFKLNSEEEEFFTPKGTSAGIEELRQLIIEEEKEWEVIGEEGENSLSEHILAIIGDNIRDGFYVNKTQLEHTSEGPPL